MSQDFNEASVPDQSGRTILVTGANTGIGYEAARVLAGRGARVLLGCRSTAKARDARERICALHPKAQVELLSLDLGNLQSVREAADEVSREARLDLLINNAGIMVPPREETADGFESQFGVNHLGHFALTGLLLEKLLATAGSRVVNVSSGAHKWGKIEFDDVNATRSYNRQARYGMSKLANLLFTFDLQRRLAGARAETIAVACHPGVSETELSRNMPAWMKLLTPLFSLLSHPPPQGALPTLRAATDPQVEGGQYYGPAGLLEMSGPPVLVEGNEASQDAQVARRLWDLSVEMTGVEIALAPA
jgi:NAD(P)-dependent dehydrogenase (short-subunit alcohol dehydrogenase family)